MKHRTVFSSSFRVLLRDWHERDFYSNLNDLKLRESKKFDKLHDVCERLQFVDLLNLYFPQYLRAINKNNSLYDLYRLVCYLSLTCIDILSSKDDYKEFDKWLINNIKESNKFTNELRHEIKEFTNDLKSFEFNEKIIKWINDNKNQYYKEYGLGNNFKNFIIYELPLWLMDYLVNIYIILDKEFNEKAYREKWVEKNLEDKIYKISEYFYFLRNNFTHTIKYIKPQETDPTYNLSLLEKNNYITYNIRYIYDGYENKILRYLVFLRSDITESDVIRLLLVYQCRSKILKIMDDETFIENYLKRIRYKRLGYLFLDELRSNLEIIMRWCLEKSIFPVDGLIRQKVISLDTKYAYEFVSFNHVKIEPSEKIFEEILKGYIELVNKANKFIKEIKSQVLDRDEMLSILVSSNDIAKVVSCIEKIQKDLHHRLNEYYY